MGFRFDPGSVVRSYVRLALNRWVISGEVMTGIEIRQKVGGMGVCVCVCVWGGGGGGLYLMQHRHQQND